eukprot:364502-Chlamydomonas_euryale.AAC.13
MHVRSWTDTLRPLYVFGGDNQAGAPRQVPVRQTACSFAVHEALLHTDYARSTSWEPATTKTIDQSTNGNEDGGKHATTQACTTTLCTAPEPPPPCWCPLLSALPPWPRANFQHVSKACTASRGEIICSTFVLLGRHAPRFCSLHPFLVSEGRLPKRLLLAPPAHLVRASTSCQRIAWRQRRSQICQPSPTAIMSACRRGWGEVVCACASEDRSGLFFWGGGIGSEAVLQAVGGSSGQPMPAAQGHMRKVFLRSAAGAAVALHRTLRAAGPAKSAGSARHTAAAAAAGQRRGRRGRPMPWPMP